LQTYAALWCFFYEAQPGAGCDVGAEQQIASPHLNLWAVYPSQKGKAPLHFASRGLDLNLSKEMML
jgi:hypothetical protein